MHFNHLQYYVIRDIVNVEINILMDNEIKTETFEDLNARIIQHEYDHLDGILYTDRAISIVLKEAV